MFTSKQLFLAVVALCTLFALASCSPPRRSNYYNYNRNRIEDNLFGDSLTECSTDPMTGYYRNGKCSTGPWDRGTHTVCAVMTDEFLQYSKSQGWGDDMTLVYLAECFLQHNKISAELTKKWNSECSFKLYFEIRNSSRIGECWLFLF